MRILIACECSGQVRRAMMAKGHDVLSCDLGPATDGSPYHYQGDVRDLLGQKWDMLIGHPPCTYLTNAAAWCFKDRELQTKRLTPGVLYGAERRAAREEAAAFAMLLWSQPIDRIVLENPVGHLSRVLGKASQIIQPHQFGDDASKGTCLWIKGLPLLQALPEGDRCHPRMVCKCKHVWRPGADWARSTCPACGRADALPRWANQTDSGQNNVTPGAGRGAERSVTYPGIAAAMAAQWG